MRVGKNIGSAIIREGQECEKKQKRHMDEKPKKKKLTNKEASGS